MVDFASMAEKAKAEHEALQLAIAKEKQDKADARTRTVHAAIAMLKEHVQPVFELAGSELKAASAIEYEMQLGYDALRTTGMMPHISFLLLGPLRENAPFRFKSFRVDVVCDGSKFELFDVTDPSRTRPDRPTAIANVERIEGVIGNAVERLLKDYYQKLRSNGRV